MVHGMGLVVSFACCVLNPPNLKEEIGDPSCMVKTNTENNHACIRNAASSVECGRPGGRILPEISLSQCNVH